MTDAPLLASLRQLLQGEPPVVAVRGGAARGSTAPPRQVLLPGSFNPLHAGHREMAHLARGRAGLPVAYELSVRNVEKATLDVDAVAARLAQFASEDLIWVTRAATFHEKAELFPACVFAVGADTALRLADAAYYDSPQAMAVAHRRLAAAECRFLVFGRLLQGKFLELDDLQLPPTLRALCEGVAATEFRQDVSSTALRRRQP